MHIREFGQTPRQIFKKLHPKKGQRTYQQIMQSKKLNDYDDLMSGGRSSFGVSGIGGSPDAGGKFEEFKESEALKK